MISGAATIIWQPRGRNPSVNGADLEESQVTRNIEKVGPGDTISVSNKVRPEASSIPIHLHKPFICFLLKPLTKNLSLIYTFVLVETHTDKPLRSTYISNVNSFIKVSLILPVKHNLPLLKTAPGLYLTRSSDIYGSLPQSTGKCVPTTYL